MRRGAAALAIGGVSLLVSGCGGSKHFENDPRPPQPITLTASIGPRSVSVSPAKFGAGPVNLLIVNQTGANQSVTFTSRGGIGFEQKTGPIVPGDTAKLQATLGRGSATVEVSSGGIRAARLTVGAERGSAQNDLLQP